MTKEFKILERIISLKRKNGKSIYVDSQLEILNKFFNAITSENSQYFKQKDYTIFINIIGKKMSSVYTFPDNFKFWESISVLNTMKLNTDEMTDDVISAKNLATLIVDFGKKFVNLKGEQPAFNKNSSKKELLDIIANSNANEVIKTICNGLEEKLVDKINKDVEIFMKDKTPNMVLYNCGLITRIGKDGYCILPLSNEEFSKRIKEFSERVVASFGYKLNNKLSSIKTDEKMRVNVLRQHSINNNTYMIETDVFSFIIDTNMVVNTSINGNPYIQYPTVFRDLTINGEKIKANGEIEVKLAIQEFYKKSK